MKKLIPVAVLLLALLVFFVMGKDPVPIASASPKDSAIAFVHLLEKGRFSSAVEHFDATMKGVMPSNKLQEAWTSLITQAGSFKRQVAVRAASFQQFRIVFVTCEFEKATLDVKVVFDNEGRIAGLFFVPSQASFEYTPPAYAKPDAFSEKDVKIGAGQWVLPGTLALPGGDGPFRAVVLVHGSGPQDRDETIGANKPFRDMAWGLASRGIAVLRYEKRTREHGKKLALMKADITVTQETVEDALAAVALLRRSEKIDPGKVFVLGHSLGGMVVPRIGLLDENIAGFIIMAGPTRPMEDMILDQTKYLFSLDGRISKTEREQLAEVKKQVARVKDPKLSADTPSSSLPLGVPASYWLDLRGYKPSEVARKLKQPMLILQGGRDYQVTMADLRGWQKTLSSRKNVKFRRYPKLNHLFIKGEGKSTPAEYLTPGHVAPSVIEDIAAWMGEQ